MNKMFCITISSFTGIPLCKKLFEEVFFEINSNPVPVYECYVDGRIHYSNAISLRAIRIFKSYADFMNQPAWFKLYKYLFVFFTLFRIVLLKKQPRIYLIDIYSVTVALVLKKLFFFKRPVIIYHQFEMNEPDRSARSDRFFLSLFKKLSTELDLVIIPEVERISYFNKSFATKPDVLFLMPNTTDLHFLGKDKNETTVFAHVGALGKDHYYKEMFKAFEGLDSLAELWIIGNITNEIVAAITECRFKSIRVFGSVPHNQLLELYKRIDFGFILYKPVDLNTKFAAPNKLYEMWSYGIPVLGPNVPGLRGVFLNDCLGKLIEMENISTFKKMLIDCISDRDNYQSEQISKFFNDHLSFKNFASLIRERIIQIK